MKRKQIIFMVVFLPFMAGNLYSQERDSPDSVINKEFKILKIDSIKNIYVIYAEQNDSVYKILSEKEVICNCQNIELNNTYILSIKTKFMRGVIIQQLGGSKYKGAVIPIREKTDGKNVAWNLYLTDDIKGRCYIRKDEQ